MNFRIDHKRVKKNILGSADRRNYSNENLILRKGSIYFALHCAEYDGRRAVYLDTCFGS